MAVIALAARLLSRHRTLLHFITLSLLIAAIAAAVAKPRIALPVPLAGVERINEDSYRVKLPKSAWPGLKLKLSGAKIKFQENGDNEGTLQSSIEEVQQLGRGRYAYADGYLYFSTLDGSDPRVNGRAYTVIAAAVVRAPIVVLAWVVTFVAMGLSAIAHFRGEQPRVSVSQRRLVLGRSSANQHIPELDGIRGWACLSVLIAHCVLGLTAPADGTILAGVRSHLLALLLGGVDLFFVLSGFLIGGILMDGRDKPHYFKRFWIRRISRIFPVLYVLLATYAAALLIRANFDLPVWDKWLLVAPRPPAWTYAAFMQSFPMAASGHGGPMWVGITWSLAIEEQFYFLFPVVVYFISRRSLLLAALAGIAVSPILRDVFERLYGHWYAPYVLLPSRMDGLMFGVLVAIIVRNARALLIAIRFRRLLDFIAIGAAYLIATTHPVLSTWPSPAGGPFPPLKQTLLAMLFAIVVLRVFTYERSALNAVWRLKPLGLVGLISYALYMYHQSVNGLLHWAIFNDIPRVETIPQLLTAALVMVVAAGLAGLSYVYIERPIRQFGHRLSDRLSAPQPTKSLSLALERERA